MCRQPHSPQLAHYFSADWCCVWDQLRWFARYHCASQITTEVPHLWHDLLRGTLCRSYQLGHTMTDCCTGSWQLKVNNTNKVYWPFHAGVSNKTVEWSIKAKEDRYLVLSPSTGGQQGHHRGAWIQEGSISTRQTTTTGNIRWHSTNISKPTFVWTDCDRTGQNSSSPSSPSNVPNWLALSSSV